MTLYGLILEKWARDLGISTAAGVTAGVQAALGGDADKPLRARVDTALHEVLEQLGKGQTTPAITSGAMPEIPPKRGPGRPRLHPKPGDAGDASDV